MTRSFGNRSNFRYRRRMGAAILFAKHAHRLLSKDTIRQIWDAVESEREAVDDAEEDDRRKRENDWLALVERTRAKDPATFDHIAMRIYTIMAEDHSISLEDGYELARKEYLSSFGLRVVKKE